MEIRQLRYFVRIVELGSMSRASGALHVAQPALSHQIARLEDELGTKLLVRTVRGVTPTEAGKAVHQHAQRLLRQFDETLRVAEAAGRGPAGDVRLGLPWTIASMLGLDVLREVREHAPAVRLEIQEGPSAALALQLAQGRLDLAVLFDPKGEGGIELKPLAEEPLRLVGQRELIGECTSPLTLDETARWPMLLLSRPNGIREALEHVWAERGLTPNVVAEINAPLLLLSAVKSGLGVSFLPSCAIEGELREGSLQAVEVHGAVLRRVVSIGTSRLFPLSQAAEHVCGVVGAQAGRAIREGRWEAKPLAALDGGVE